MVDTLGLLLAAVVHPADIQDRDGARLVLERLVGRYDRLQVIWADGAYGGKLVEWAKLVGGWSLELVRRPAGQHTFQVLHTLPSVAPQVGRGTDLRLVQPATAAQ